MTLPNFRQGTVRRPSHVSRSIKLFRIGSEQVPAKVVFLTDGPSRTVKIGATTIQLRRTTPKNMAMAGRLIGLLIPALRELGKKKCDHGAD